MTDRDDAPQDETPAQKALRLKRAATQPGRAGPSGPRRADERAAAARSASKSKPALRK